MHRRDSKMFEFDIRADKRLLAKLDTYCNCVFLFKLVTIDFYWNTLNVQFFFFIELKRKFKNHNKRNILFLINQISIHL